MKKCHFDYVNEHPQMSCRKLAEYFPIGKKPFHQQPAKGLHFYQGKL